MAAAILNKKIERIKHSVLANTLEMKEAISRNTYTGFLFSLLTFGFAFLLFSQFVKPISNITDIVPVGGGRIEIIGDDIILPTDDGVVKEVPVELPKGPVAPPAGVDEIGSGPAMVAGNVIGIDDSKIADDAPEFATVENMSRASAIGGSGIDDGKFSDRIEFSKPEPATVKVEKEAEIPPEYAFIPVEKEPVVDLARLSSVIEYPDLAKRAGVEGQVLVRVYIDQKGNAHDPFVDYSESSLLNNAALNAVKNYGKFIPAVQNGEPIGCWLSIPIRFKLR